MSRQSPTLDARRSRDGRQLIVWCLYCARDHFHGRHSETNDCSYTRDYDEPCTCPLGTGDGHRAAHCHDPSSPYANSGYVIREVRP